MLHCYTYFGDILHRFGLSSPVIFLETTSERGEWEPQIFFFKIFDRCPKITSSANEISEAKLPKPTHDKSTKRVIGKVETKRNRQNAICNSNQQTAHKTELADCPLQCRGLSATVPCTLALVDVPDVSHRGWSPDLFDNHSS